MPKHIFFDLDNTLMLSRTTMAPAHQPLFRELCEKKDVIVVSGAQESQIRNQIPDSIGAKFFVLGQTGNQALDKDRKQLWKESFTDEQKEATFAFIEVIKKEMGLTVKDPSDLVEDRGAQISYSPIGHHESLENKYAFDPGAAKRKAILAEHATDVTSLAKAGVDVLPGGTTCFDFYLAGRNKGFNVARLIEQEGWTKEDSLYIGDALFKGGNDETVIGVIPTHPVKGPDETFVYISKLLS
jgi:HAD superfamily hydrolase (TIGR01484 family)